MRFRKRKFQQIGYTMSYNEFVYSSGLQTLLHEGEVRTDRTGTGTISMFGDFNRYMIRDSFPLMTGRKINFKAIVDELFWFLSGSTNVNDLTHARHWWEPFANEDGSIGPGYGKQWRDFNGTDQIAELIDGLANDPYSRRHIVSAWNASDISKMNLPPCHVQFQFFVSNDRGLSCHLTQRSADALLGAPTNIASYSLLTYMIAHCLDMYPDEFCHSIGDHHIYSNHVEQVEEYLSAEKLEPPTVRIDGPKDFFQLRPEHIILENYNYSKDIKAKLAI